MALFISWDEVDGVDEEINTIKVECCCMKQSFKNFMKKSLKITVSDNLLYSICIYHFILNICICAMFIHFRVAATILQWLFGDRIMQTEFLYVFLVYFCNILLFMQMLDEFGAIIITIFCKCNES